MNITGVHCWGFTNMAMFSHVPALCFHRCLCSALGVRERHILLQARLAHLINSQVFSGMCKLLRLGSEQCLEDQRHEQLLCPQLRSQHLLRGDR